MDRPGPFEVDTPLGPRPFVPPGPELAPRPKDNENPGNDLPDNPENPRGKPSLSLPQQATPLTSDQGVLTEEDVAHALDDPKKLEEMTAQDGLAPDNPLNPRGTPDYFVNPHVEGQDEPDEEARAAGK